MKCFLLTFIGMVLFSPAVYSFNSCNSVFDSQNAIDLSEDSEIDSFYPALTEQLSKGGIARLNNIFALAKSRSFQKDPLVVELLNKIENAYKGIELGYYASSFRIDNPNTYITGRIESAYGETKIVISTVILNELQYNENLSGADFRFAKILYGFLLASQKIWDTNKNTNQITLVADQLANQKLKQLLFDIGMKGQFDLYLRLKR